MSEKRNRCEQCYQRYSLFHRKKQCNLCGQTFCSKCIVKQTITISRACRICLFIINDRTTRNQLATVRIKHLIAYLIHSKIISNNRLNACLEKEDLINLIESSKRHIEDTLIETNDSTHAQIITDDGNIYNSDQESTQQSNITDINETSLPHSNSSAAAISNDSQINTANIHLSLDDIVSIESIQNLNVRQLKTILIQNFVSVKGCVEKYELINKVEMLYRDRNGPKQPNMIESNQESYDNMCKICLSEPIDCVFLDCGHLCSCIQCSKRLSECPLCRSYIIRVLRVFKG